MIKDLEKKIKLLKSVELGGSAKEHMLSEIQAFVRFHPVRKEFTNRHTLRGWSPSFINLIIGKL